MYVGSATHVGNAPNNSSSPRGIKTYQRVNTQFATMERLTHCGLVTSCGDNNRGQHRLRHQALHWINVDLLSKVFCDIQLSEISQEVPMSLINDIHPENMISKLSPSLKCQWVNSWMKYGSSTIEWPCSLIAKILRSHDVVLTFGCTPEIRLLSYKVWLTVLTWYCYMLGFRWRKIYEPQ